MAKFIVLALVLFITAPFASVADETSTRQQEVLVQQQARLQAELVAGGKLGGVRREQLVRERRQIQDLISRLESGAKVDPKEIDRLVGTQQPVYFESPRARSSNLPPKHR